MGSAEDLEILSVRLGESIWGFVSILYLVRNTEVLREISLNKKLLFHLLLCAYLSDCL